MLREVASEYFRSSNLGPFLHLEVTQSCHVNLHDHVHNPYSCRAALACSAKQNKKKKMQISVWPIPISNLQNLERSED